MVSTAVVSTALVSTALPQVTLPPVPSGLGLGAGLAHGTSESKDEAVQTCSKSPVGTRQAVSKKDLQIVAQTNDRR